MFAPVSAILNTSMTISLFAKFAKSIINEKSIRKCVDDSPAAVAGTSSVRPLKSPRIPANTEPISIVPSETLSSNSTEDSIETAVS